VHIARRFERVFSAAVSSPCIFPNVYNKNPASDFLTLPSVSSTRYATFRPLRRPQNPKVPGSNPGPATKSSSFFDNFCQLSELAQPPFNRYLPLKQLPAQATLE